MKRDFVTWYVTHGKSEERALARRSSRTRSERNLRGVSRASSLRRPAPARSARGGRGVSAFPLESAAPVGVSVESGVLGWSQLPAVFVGVSVESARSRWSQRGVSLSCRSQAGVRRFRPESAWGRRGVSCLWPVGRGAMGGAYYTPPRLRRTATTTTTCCHRLPPHTAKRRHIHRAESSRRLAAGCWHLNRPSPRQTGECS